MRPAARGSEPRGPRAWPWAGSAGAALLGFVPLALAAALTRSAAALQRVPFSEAVMFPPEGAGAGGFGIALAAMLAGYAGVYFAPGLLVMRALRIRPGHAVSAAIAAFALSLAGVSVSWALAQAVARGVGGRLCLYLTVAALDAAALLVAVFSAPGAPALPRLAEGQRGRGRAELVVPAAGVLLLIAAVWFLMPGKITTEALEGDATEVHGFAASLFRGALPEWDLESGVWGFYPTFMFVAYPVFFSLALLGECEAAVRLPALLFFGVMQLAMADLAGRGRSRAAGGTLRVLAPLLAAGYLSLQVGAYYAGYHPFHGDLGCSPLEEWMVTALAAAAVLLVREGSSGLAALAALLAVLTFPSGLLLIALLGAAGVGVGPPERRAAVLRAGFLLGGLLAAYAVLLIAVCAARGTLDSMLGEWYAKYFRGRAQFGAEHPARMLRALGWYVLLAGGLPAAGFVLAAVRGDRTARWLALASGAWVAFFLLSPNKNIHYFLPVALVPTVLAVRATLRPCAPCGREVLFCGALVVSSLVAIVLCRPRSVPPYTADRDFGRRTLFLAGSEREAVEYARVLQNVAPPLWRWRPGGPWTVGRHTWVLYADRGFEPTRAYDFYVGRGAPPVPGLEEITRVSLSDGGAAFLWSPRGRAAIREWKAKRFPLRKELSRFNFDMPIASRGA